ncbi:MAG TPA: hypothetical protein VE988_30720 [Gemmataceae bacterium]|nr:hypothetical protein [Gemmataceae bacterium]
MITQPYERAAVVATTDPANINNSTVTSDAVDMSKFHEALFIIILGAVDAAITAKLQESATAGGSYSDISGKAITALGGTDDNKQVVINLKSSEMTPSKSFVKLSITCANGTTNIVGSVAIGMKPRFGPASDDDLSSVAEIVT